MIHHVEVNNGSREMETTIKYALNKRLMFDILIQRKLPAEICSCDLKSCYDIIVYSFASIATQREGVPAAAIKSMITTIQRLKHAVRILYRDSEQMFGGEDWRTLKQLHGIG